ncbi:hypothetical protein TRFO_42165 [Tritrichomonas foetus]|uniref:Uncharacterized protein n=1 Tax=Tritrichomonas foetus TaxID=1144522 RepID=A0A1J4L254_9EUKA|nr:hypothetical protein TRFO_42165 [Tritrichomonas foetus]|eukprot:OHT15973.1 hypothetical protein TRFO_42165 [Tritrichomonas foetus]
MIQSHNWFCILLILIFQFIFLTLFLNSMTLSFMSVSEHKNIQSFDLNEKINNTQQYNIIIVLTVWKRNFLHQQLSFIESQTICSNNKVMVSIFQNFHHINIKSIVDDWINKNNKSFDIDFIKSPIETGYYGRFLVPLVYKTYSPSYFIICDDDVIWGNKYFENMIRVVNEGSLATRNGRFIIPVEIGAKLSRLPITFEEDIEVDFGGHIWAGKIEWLQNAWRHPPPLLANCEDFWLSAVLKTFFNISTKKPKCPIHEFPQMCSCSHKNASSHKSAVVGQTQIKNDWGIRAKGIKMIVELYNFTSLNVKGKGLRDENHKYLYHDQKFVNSIPGYPYEPFTECLFWS